MFSSARVGLFTFSLPRELVDLAERWNDVVETKLKELGLEVHAPNGLIYDISTARRAVEQLKDKKLDAAILLIGTWTYPPAAVTVAESLNAPIILWGVPDTRTFGLVGAATIHGSFDDLGLKHFAVYGFPDDPDVIKELLTYINASKVVMRMKGAKFGLVGGRSLGMYTSLVDFIQVKKVFGVEIEHIDEYLVFLEAEKVSDEEIDSLMESVRANYGRIEPSEEILRRSLRLYFALKRIIKEQEFDFIGVKCQPEMIDNYVSYCLAQALLNNEGIITACESDVNGALTMYILHLLSGQPVLFADINSIDYKSNTIRLVNCGAAATALASSFKDVDLGLQYEYMGKKRGVTTVFCCKPGEVTLARLARIKGAYVMEIARGEAFEQPKEKFAEARDRWPHAFIKLHGSVKRFIKEARSNHIHMVYGDFVDELIAVCDLLDICPIVIR